MSRIALLSDELVNKIAAGEVVERPASVVKELCENAIDAGASVIRVQLRAGGMNLVRVVDDGTGMSREESLLALRRHATSKLRALDDLFSLMTKGFRGEALPAIASVSRFTLTTAMEASAVGTQVTVEGGSLPQVEDAAPVQGTDIRVEDLFFNTPARRKFLKREQTELAHAQDAVIRLALAHPEVAFHMEHEGRQCLSAPVNGADLRERIAAVLGPEVFEHLVPVEEDRLGLKIYGYVASPAYTLSNARGVYTFVNRRYVRDRGLNFALQRGFHESLPPGRQPLAVLFVDMEPSAVDVNVHPQKLEVRFADVRGVTEAMTAAIIRGLRRVLSPATESSNATQEAGVPSQTGQTPHYARAVERYLGMAAEAAWGAPLPLPALQEGASGGGRTGFGTARPDVNAAPPAGFFGKLTWLAVWQKRFWLCENDAGTLVVLDAHAAWERAHLTRFLESAAGLGESSQASLFSKTVTLPVEEAELLEERAAVLQALGIDVEGFGGTTFAVQKLPPSLHEADLIGLFSDVCRVLPEPPVEDWLPVCQVLACHAARSSARRAPSHDELRTLFRQLDQMDFSVAVHHERVVARQVPLLDVIGTDNPVS